MANKLLFKLERFFNPMLTKISAVSEMDFEPYKIGTARVLEKNHGLDDDMVYIRHFFDATYELPTGETLEQQHNLNMFRTAASRQNNFRKHLFVNKFRERNKNAS